MNWFFRLRQDDEEHFLGDLRAALEYCQERLRAEAAQATAALKARGVTPGLAVILVGDDAGSQIYVRNKEKACAEAGIAAHDAPGKAGGEHLGG